MGGNGETYWDAYERYAELRGFARALLSEEALRETQTRVEVRPITSDILSTVRNSWRTCPDRVARWDWAEVVKKLATYGPRTLDMAFYGGYPLRPQLCGLAVAKVSPHKRWLSLTHIEACPFTHPLKGHIFPFALSGVRAFRALICTPEEAEKMGTRILSPTTDALPFYRSRGYTDHVETKHLSYLVVEPPESPP